jgi:hypothetical protein
MRLRVWNAVSTSADAAHHSARARASPQFAVRPETHSPHLKEGMTVGDLVRRVANVVPNKHTVRLVQPQKTILLMVVAVRACARVCCAMREQRTRHVCTGVLTRRIVLIAPLHACSLLLLARVQDCAMLSVVEDWHALHKFNVHEIRKEAGTA